MQKAQLYIEGQRVDVFEDISLSITDTIKNVKDVSKVFTEYSQTFSLPASKTNNKIFKHYYNSDIQNGFDARIRVTANIELNSIPFKSGYIKLEGVDLKDNVANTYRITFFGNTVSLKNLLGDDLLSSLAWLENFSKEEDGTDLLWNPTFIQKYLTTPVYNRVVDGDSYPLAIQVPLITHTQRLTYNSHSSANDSGNVAYSQGNHHGVGWNQLKYALRLSIIIKAIEKKYGIVFSSDFFNGGDSSFDNLYMWLHRAKGKVTTGEQINSYLYFVNDFPDYSLYNGSFMENSVLTLNDGYYYSNQVLRLNFNIAQGYETVPYSVTVFRDGTPVYTGTDLTGSNINISVPVSNNSEYTVQITTNASVGFVRVFWVYSYYDSDSDEFLSEDYYTPAFSTPESFDFNITQQIPKMKVLDFLTSIFRMFNLVAYVEGGVVVVKDLDSFYASGDSYDITKYVDVSNKKRDAALPFKEIIYTYKGLGSFLAKQHEQISNKDWGKEEYKGSDGLILYGGTFNNEIPFEHMKFERLLDSNTSALTDIQYGYCVDDNQESYIGSPIIFYMALETLSQTPTDGRISFINQFTNNVPSDHIPLSSYYVPANSDLQVTEVNDRQSLNFSSEFDEWELTTTNQTLFNNYHSNYISNVFNSENRITKLSAYLPLRILLKYNLSDRFVISGDSYKINSIETDLHTGKSDLELLKDIPPSVIDTTPPSPVTDLSLVQGSETQTSFAIQWTKPAGGVVGYDLYLQQEYVQTIGDVTSFTITGLDIQIEYKVDITSFDASGNDGGTSNIIFVEL